MTDSWPGRAAAFSLEAVSSLDLPCNLCALDPPLGLPELLTAPSALLTFPSPRSGLRPHPAPRAISLPHPTPGCVPLFPTGQPVFSKRSRPREPGPRFARGKRKRNSRGSGGSGLESQLCHKVTWLPSSALSLFIHEMGPWLCSTG